MKFYRFSSAQMATFGRNCNTTMLIVKIGPVAIMTPAPKRFAKPNDPNWDDQGNRVLRSFKKHPPISEDEY